MEPSYAVCPSVYLVITLAKLIPSTRNLRTIETNEELHKFEDENEFRNRL